MPPIGLCGFDLVPTRRMPDVEKVLVFVRSYGGDRTAAGQELGRTHQGGVSTERHDFLVAGGVPQFDGILAPATGQDAAGIR